MGDINPLNLTTDYITLHFERNTGCSIGNKLENAVVTHMDYAIGIVIICTASSSSSNSAPQPVMSISPTARTNPRMAICADTDAFTPITINGEYIDFVDEFTYLGSMVAVDAFIDHKMAIRIGKAENAMTRLANILWDRPSISRKTKLRCSILLSYDYNSVVQRLDCVTNHTNRRLYHDMSETLEKHEIFPPR